MSEPQNAPNLARQLASPAIESSKQDPDPELAPPDSPGRRSFLGAAAALITAGVAGGSALATTTAAAASAAPAATRMITPTAALGQDIAPETDIGPATGHKRAKQASSIRIAAAKAELQLPVADHPTNGDEQLYANKIGNYSKGLPHNS